jgi:hypothetical protein
MNEKLIFNKRKKKIMYRFIICVDIESNSLKRAYSKLYNELAKVDIDWESTDEAYDIDGKLISKEELSEARIAFFNEEEL